MSEDIVEEGGGGKALLIVGIVLGIAMGAGLGYFVFSGSEKGADVSQESEVIADEKMLTISFERVALPIYLTRSNGGRARFIGNYFLDISIEVEGDDDQARVNRARAPLTQAFISSISKGGFLQEGTTEVDYPTATQKIKDAGNRLLGDNVIKRVSFTNVMRVS